MHRCCSALSFALILMISPSCDAAAGSLAAEDEECLRWSVDEFIHTLFLPVVERELSYVEGVVDAMLGGMAEVASGLNHERSIIGVDVKEIQKAINHLESEFKPLFVYARRSIEDAVIEALRPNEAGERRTLLRELRLDFQHIHQTIHAVHASLEEPFDLAARAAKTMLDPMVALVKIFVQEDPQQQESRRAEMLLRLKERNKLLGRVAGELVLKEVEGDAMKIKHPDFLIRLDDFWKDFTVILYQDGMGRSVAHSRGDMRDTSEEKFWRLCIEALRKKDYATNRKYCGKKSSQSDAYCDDRRMVDLVTAAVYHASTGEEGEEGGLEWVKKLEQKA